MIDLSEDMDLVVPYSSSTSDVIDNQSQIIQNGSINGTLHSVGTHYKLSDGTMRFLFIAIATITVLICLTICIFVCICICLNRRRKLKRQGKKDHLLLPKQSERISVKKLSIRNSVPKNNNSNSKQQSDKKISSSSIPQSASNIFNEKTPIGSYYYDNLDDIPFIDESRPTSFIDITRV